MAFFQTLVWGYAFCSSRVLLCVPRLNVIPQSLGGPPVHRWALKASSRSVFKSVIITPAPKSREQVSWSCLTVLLTAGRAVHANAQKPRVTLCLVCKDILGTGSPLRL
jgi:hypothetical protein